MKHSIKRREFTPAVHRMMEQPRAVVKPDLAEEIASSPAVEPVKPEKKKAVRPEIIFDYSLAIPCGGPR